MVIQHRPKFGLCRELGVVDAADDPVEHRPLDLQCPQDGIYVEADTRS